MAAVGRGQTQLEPVPLAVLRFPERVDSACSVNASACAFRFEVLKSAVFESR